MSAMLILRKGHGNVLSVATFTLSSIGRFANKRRRRLKPHNSSIPAAEISAA
jgi:hypothetical protein